MSTASLIAKQLPTGKMTCEWYAALFLATSNLAMLPAIVLAYMYSHPWCGTYFSIVMTVSTLYHMCSCGMGCWLFPLWTYGNLDYICSHGMVPILCAFLMDLRSWKWRAVVYQLSFVLCMAMVLTDRHNWEYRIAMLGFGLAALLTKVVVIDRRLPPAVQGRSYGITAMGLGLILIGVLLFTFKMPGRYWITHSFWHMLVFAGTALVVYGFSRKPAKRRRSSAASAPHTQPPMRVQFVVPK